MSGAVSNQGRFYSCFDAVVLLSAPAEVLLRRIESRTTNAYRKTIEERRLILSHVAEVEPLLRATTCTHEIDATQRLLRGLLGRNKAGKRTARLTSPRLDPGGKEQRGHEADDPSEGHSCHRPGVGAVPA
jgi:hypothetical protein